MGTYGLTWTLAQVVAPGLGMCLFSASPMAFWIVGGGLGVAAALIAFQGRASAAPVMQGA
jgi:hypothetical protein